MREIEFRAKGIEENDKNKWYYGSYYKTDDTTYCFKEDYDRNPNNTHHYILFDKMTDWCLPNKKLRADINIETLGQYIGLRDKNSKKIYEGDIVKTKLIDIVRKNNKWVEDITYQNYVVEFSNEDLGFRFKENDDVLWKCIDCEHEVVGNIYDNPELIE